MGIAGVETLGAGEEIAVVEEEGMMEAVEEILGAGAEIVVAEKVMVEVQITMICLRLIMPLHLLIKMPGISDRSLRCDVRNHCRFRQSS
jgi:hypothetical protein